MATTSLWHIEGRLKDLIDYVENLEKTKAKAPELQDLYNVFSYVQRPEATQEGEYVTALNCLRETALRQMILTKKRYGKTDGYIGLARLPELQASGSYTAACPRDRRKAGKGNVGRPL